MSSIVRFAPRAELECKHNLASYIDFQLIHLPKGIGPWDEDIWDTTAITQKRVRSKSGNRLHFRSWEASKGNSSRILNPNEIMASPFKEFAKAYIAEVCREKQLSELGRILKATQALAAATSTLRGTACVTKVDGGVVDLAAQLIGERYPPNSAWNYGRTLEALAGRIKEAGLTEWRLPWKQPFAYLQPPRNDRVNKEVDNRVGERLPDVRAVLALGEIHHQASDDADKVPTAFAALAMIAPERAGEILTLPTDCKTSMSRNGKESLGVRWKPLKGGQAKTNWAITPDAAEVANNAIDYLIQRGQKARTAAHWYADNPDKLYLPPGLEYLRNFNAITLWEAAQIMGRHTVPKPCHKTKAFGFTDPVSTISGADLLDRIAPTEEGLSRVKHVKTYLYEELERFVLNKLPDTFPVADASCNLHYQDTLWCLPMNILRPDGETLEYIPQIITTNQINHQFGSNPGGVTIFSRNGKVDDDGRPWKISSHQFRHLLNTLAQSKYLSQELIAFWSGRKHVGQNAWYNHLPQEAFIEAYLKIESGIPDLNITGPLQDKIEATEHAHSISRKDAIGYELGATHKTRYGICRHDYALTPCPKDKDCINCGEHVFIKGDATQIAEANEQIQLFRSGVEQALTALADGRFGAQRWLDLHKPKLEKWELALSKLTDPEVTDGTIITMPKPDVSQSKTGLAQSILLAEMRTSNHELLNMIGMD